MNNIAIRLAIKFFEEVKGFKRDSNNRIEAPDTYKNKVMKEVQEILQGGMHEKQLEDLMDRYVKEHPSPKEVYNVQDILNNFKVDAKKVVVKFDPNNLIESGKFYYHPALQVAPPPPTVVQLDDGTFESSYETEEFFLEVKEKFTLDDLVNYFYNIMEIKDSGMKERHVGAFRHILKSNDIDVILYTIDEARAMAEDLNRPRPKNPFDITDYIDYGIEVLEERKNTCYMEGLDRVIPRGTK
jgi:hypothetical protein